MAVAKQLGSLVETIKSKVRFLKKKSKNKTSSSSPVYVKMDKSASVKVEIQSRHARKLINETLKAADSPRKRSIS